MIVLMQQHIAQVAPCAPATTWGRTFASLYDPFLWTGERAGVRQLRRTLLGQARGRTVDIGSGSGLNLPHFPDHLDELVLAEPDPAIVPGGFGVPLLWEIEPPGRGRDNLRQA